MLVQLLLRAKRLNRECVKELQILIYSDGVDCENALANDDIIDGEEG